jgi:metal-responsive CopG/Arc/MetJ family transcriptional regulator
LKDKKGINLRISEDLLKEFDDWLSLFLEKGYDINRSDAISAILSEYIEQMETTAHMESVKTSAYDLKLLIDYYYNNYNLVRRRSNGS